MHQASAELEASGIEDEITGKGEKRFLVSHYQTKTVPLLRALNFCSRTRGDYVLPRPMVPLL